jgi:hypothetical protein
MSMTGPDTDMKDVGRVAADDRWHGAAAISKRGFDGSSYHE